ncbi:hypothetical protein BDV06DRAFT_213669 [Aspergillus oleicola]
MAQPPPTPGAQSTRRTVPSLSFLLRHTNKQTNKKTRLVFDLGIRRNLSDYAEPIYKHAMTRQPVSGIPDVVESLEKGGLGPDDIDIIIFSHLHWDHVGTPGDFPSSKFVIGLGAGNLLTGNSGVRNGSHSHFEEGLLDRTRTIELHDPDFAQPVELEHDINNLAPQTQQQAESLPSTPWKPLGPFPATLDIFGDGSLYIVSAPGHLPGHINLLARQDHGSYVYLAGDVCHDPRLLSGEKSIATWTDLDFPGVTCCIHANKDEAERTLEWIRQAKSGETELGSVEVVFAHDGDWAVRAKEQGRFWPGVL